MTKNKKQFAPTKYPLDAKAATAFIKTLSEEDIDQGTWFTLLLQKMVGEYVPEKRGLVLAERYPNATRDEAARLVIKHTARQASVFGVSMGLLTSTTQMMNLAQRNVSPSFFMGILGNEMVMLTALQLQLVCDLALIYTITLNPNIPDPIWIIFDEALKANPLDVVSRLGKLVMQPLAKQSAKKYLTNTLLEDANDTGQIVGLTILQRTVLKYIMPLASTAVGARYNYRSTKGLGKVGQDYFKRLAKIDGDEWGRIEGD